MTSDHSDSSSRLSDALDDLFKRRASRGAAPAGDTDPDDGLDDTDPGGVEEPVPEPELSAGDSDAPRESWVLPEIVLATEPADEREIQDEPAVPAAPVMPTMPVTAQVPPPTAQVPQGPTAAAPIAAAAPATTAPATSWGDHMPVVSVPGAGELRVAGRRPRVRRVTRVVRHVDPWSVFKVGLIFSLATYVVLLSSGVLLWRVADSTGSLDNVERWFTQFGWETFEFDGGAIFSNAWVIGLFGVVAMTGGFVLLATLFNLVSDIVGGIRVTVLEEEVVERTMSNARRYVVRRPVDVGTEAPTSNWSVDDDRSEDGHDASTSQYDGTPPPASTRPPTTRSAGTTGSAVRPGDWSVDD